VKVSLRLFSQAYVSYTPYGDVDQSTSFGADMFRAKFGGHEYEQQIGGLSNVNYYYYGARYYNPDPGQYITPDPMGQYSNPYTYAGSNPQTLTDPNGMWAGGGGGGGAMGGVDPIIWTGMSGNNSMAGPSSIPPSPDAIHLLIN
jgi:RHS repeat-associated protein